MKGLAVNLLNFLKSLTIIDYILYFAVLALIILVVSLLYLLKTTAIEEENIEDGNEEFDIKNTMEQLSQSQPKSIELNKYEQEQEEKAIISYEELVKSIKRNEINYENTEMIDNQVSVKKINLDTLIKDQEENKSSIRVISFDHEEEFLKALKQLQRELN